MTVTYLGEIPEGRKAVNTKGTRTYTRTFKLFTSSKSEDAYSVGSNASLPTIGATHPSDALAWCVSLSVDCTDGWTGWVVSAEYSAERELNNDPTLDPAVITWDSEQFQRPAINDYSGNAIVNSAGDPFDPPNMMDDSRRVVTVSKNLAVVPVWILTYQDAVNSDSFVVDNVTIGIGLAKIQRVAVGEQQERNGTAFRTVNFTIHLQKDGWLLEPLDAGFREIEYGVGRVNIVNEGDGLQPSAPVPLDGAGVHIAEPTLSNCIFLSFTVYETKIFSTLPLT